MTKVLEGGVQRAGDRVRVTVQLIDAATDAHLWAESYDRELTAANIFAIQSEVAAAIAGALKAALTAGEQARVDAIPTQNLEAWQAYQLGKQRMAKRNSAALTEAEEHFRKAITLDPKFALAWTGLADTLALQTSYGGRPQDAGLGDAEQAVAKALELDQNLAEAWASAGLIAATAAVRARRTDVAPGDRAQSQLRPGASLVEHCLARPRPPGRGSGGGGARRGARSPVGDHQQLLGWARMNVGRFDDALVAFRQAIEIDPAMAIGVLTHRRRAGVTDSDASTPRWRGTRRRRVLTRAIPDTRLGSRPGTGTSGMTARLGDGSIEHWRLARELHTRTALRPFCTSTGARRRWRAGMRRRAAELDPGYHVPDPRP